MDLTPYIEGLQRDLTASAAPGGAEVTRAAELLTGSIEASARLCLLEALSEAAAEITTKLGTATVDVRLRGREADLTVTEIAAVVDEPAPAPSRRHQTPATSPASRCGSPESLKEQAERAAAAEGISVNAWLVRAVAAAVGGGRPHQPAGTPRSGRRVTGFAQA